MSNPSKKSIRERDQNRRLADPGTYAAADAAAAGGRARFDAQMTAVFVEMQALLDGRSLRSLAGADALKFMSLRAEYDALAIEQKKFVEMDFAARLNPDEGDGDIPAKPRTPISPSFA